MGLFDLVDQEQAATAEEAKTNAVQKTGFRQSDLIELLSSGVPEGDRNNKLTSFAGILRNHNFGQTMIEGILRSINISTGMNLPEKEVVTISRSVARYTPKQIEEQKPETSTEVIRTIKSFEKDLYDAFKNGFVHRGLSTGWKSMDENYLISKQMLNVLTGIPGHGKSEWMDALMLNTCHFHNWKWLLFSPENYPVTLHIRKLAEKFLMKNFKVLTDEEFRYAVKYLNEHFLIIPPADNGYTLNFILDSIQERMKTEKIDGVMIDPWNELIPEMSPGETETNYIGRCLSQCRHFARKNDIAFFIVAHPTKMRKDKNDEHYLVPNLYDIKGSSCWFDKCDNGICIYRHFGAPDVDVHIQKVKFKIHGQPGMVKFLYDKQTGEYNEAQPVEEDYSTWAK
jgi:twinkle protein